MHIWFLQKPEEANRPSGPGVIGSCEPPRGGQETNLRPLEDQKVPLTTESSL